MIKLHQFRPTFGLPNASPFCMKIETFLRMAGLEYETVPVDNPGRLPKGKAPVLEDDGEMIADSTFIIEHLRRKYGIGLDDGLSAEQKATGWAFGRMLEEHYYWTVVYSRWIDERGWRTIKNAFFPHLPPVVRSIVPELVRRGIRKTLYAHGIGRHSPEQIYGLAREDLASVAAQLGRNSFFLGPSPTSVDAIVYAFLANSAFVPLDTPIQHAVAEFANVKPYCERMRRQYFSEGNCA